MTDTEDNIVVKKRRWPRRLLLAVMFLLLLVVGAILWLDSSSGQRWAINRLASLNSKSGFQMTIGDFDGSLYSKARVRDVQLKDIKGTFLTIHDADIDWSPWGLANKKVTIRAAHVRHATWHYLPRFNPADPDAPLLPNLDINIGNIRIDRLTLDPRLAQKKYDLRATGKVRLDFGTVDATLDVAALNAPDALQALVKAVPDKNRFDLDLKLKAPGDGLLSTLTGWKPGGRVTLDGKGDYRTWRGKLLAETGDTAAVSADVTISDGTLGLDGQLQAPDGINPRLATLLTAMPSIKATASLKKNIASSGGILSGPDASLAWTASIDSQAARILAADAKLVDTKNTVLPLLDPDLKAAGMTVTATAANAFRMPDVSVSLATKNLAWRAYSLENVKATAVTRAVSSSSKWAVTLAAQNGKTGLPWLDPKLATLSATTQLTVAKGTLAADALQIKGNDLDARGAFTTRFADGSWRAVVTQLVTQIQAGENGLVPLTLKATASSPGRNKNVGIVLAGNASLQKWQGPAEMIRLLGKSPDIRATIVVQPDGSTRATSLRVAGNGSAFEGTLALSNGQIEAKLDGRVKSLKALVPGLAFDVDDNLPVALVVTGPIDNPTIAGDIRAQYVRVAGADMRNVMLRLEPAGARSWQTQLTADAPFGRLDASALLQTGAAGIRIDRLAGIAGPAKITGTVQIDRAGLATGKAQLTLDQVRQSLALNMIFDAVQGQQNISSTIAGANINQMWNKIPLTAGQINGTVNAVLGKTPDLNIDLKLKTAAYADWRISDLALAGRGSPAAFAGTYSVAGTRGAPFTLTGNLKTSGTKNLPDVIELTAAGQLAQRSLKLSTPARLVRQANGWRLDKTELTYAGGSASLSGTQSGTAISGTVDLANTNLELLDLLSPNLGLTGKASGKTDFQLSNGKLTGLTGTLAVKRLRRAGLFQSSLPLDIAGTVALEGAALRAQMQLRANGRDAGNADIRILKDGGGGLAGGALNGNFVYSGPAEALWGLVGTDANDIRGKLDISSALAGTVDNPRVRGTIAMRDGRYENVALGLVVNMISADGTFEGSQLSIESLQGKFPAGGSVTAKGRVNVSAEQGFPAEINLALQQATVIKREDLEVTATGPLVVTYGAAGGKISGPLTINQARYRAGGAVKETVPEIEVREINKPATALTTAPRRTLKPFQLDMDVTARQRLFVTGLGLTSEWGGKVSVKGTATAPRLTGQMAVIRGTYDFSGRRFDVDEGIISFQGVTPINPVVSIRASTRAGDRDIILRVGGTAGQPDIQFSASPSLPQDEVLSRLLFGSSIKDLSPLEAVQLAGALNQLSSARGGLNVLGSVKRATGIDRLRVLAADRSKGKGTALSGGKYLTDRVYVEVSTDGRGYTATTIEIDITRTLSVLSEIATLGGTNVGVKWSKDY
jgi:translocation and assembly module TamB